MLKVVSNNCYLPFNMFTQHIELCKHNRILCSILLGLLYFITTSFLTYSANHLTEIEENIYKICHIKCISEFLHYE